MCRWLLPLLVLSALACASPLDTFRNTQLRFRVDAAKLPESVKSIEFLQDWQSNTYMNGKAFGIAPIPRNSTGWKENLEYPISYVSGVGLLLVYPILFGIIFFLCFIVFSCIRCCTCCKGCVCCQCCCKADVRNEYSKASQVVLRIGLGVSALLGVIGAVMLACTTLGSITRRPFNTANNRIDEAIGKAASLGEYANKVGANVVDYVDAARDIVLRDIPNGLDKALNLCKPDENDKCATDSVVAKLTQTVKLLGPAVDALAHTMSNVASQPLFQCYDYVISDDEAKSVYTNAFYEWVIGRDNISVVPRTGSSSQCDEEGWDVESCYIANWAEAVSDYCGGPEMSAQENCNGSSLKPDILNVRMSLNSYSDGPIPEFTKTADSTTWRCIADGSAVCVDGDCSCPEPTTESKAQFCLLWPSWCKDGEPIADPDGQYCTMTGKCEQRPCITAGIERSFLGLTSEDMIDGGFTLPVKKMISMLPETINVRGSDINIDQEKFKDIDIPTPDMSSITAMVQSMSTITEALDDVKGLFTNDTINMIKDLEQMQFESFGDIIEKVVDIVSEAVPQFGNIYAYVKEPQAPQACVVNSGMDCPFDYESLSADYEELAKGMEDYLSVKWGVDDGQLRLVADFTNGVTMVKDTLSDYQEQTNSVMKIGGFNLTWVTPILALVLLIPFILLALGAIFNFRKTEMCFLIIMIIYSLIIAIMTTVFLTLPIVASEAKSVLTSLGNDPLGMAQAGLTAAASFQTKGITDSSYVDAFGEGPLAVIGQNGDKAITITFSADTVKTLVNGGIPPIYLGDVPLIATDSTNADGDSGNSTMIDDIIDAIMGNKTKTLRYEKETLAALFTDANANIFKVLQLTDLMDFLSDQLNSDTLVDVFNIYFNDVEDDVIANYVDQAVSMIDGISSYSETVSEFVEMVDLYNTISMVGGAITYLGGSIFDTVKEVLVTGVNQAMPKMCALAELIANDPEKSFCELDDSTGLEYTNNTQYCGCTDSETEPACKQFFHYFCDPVDVNMWAERMKEESMTVNIGNQEYHVTTSAKNTDHRVGPIGVYLAIKKQTDSTSTCLSDEEREKLPKIDYVMDSKVAFWPGATDEDKEKVTIGCAAKEVTSLFENDPTNKVSVQCDSTIREETYYIVGKDVQNEVPSAPYFKVTAQVCGDYNDAKQKLLAITSRCITGIVYKESDEKDEESYKQFASTYDSTDKTCTVGLLDSALYTVYNVAATALDMNGDGNALLPSARTAIVGATGYQKSEGGTPTIDRDTLVENVKNVFDAVAALLVKTIGLITNVMNPSTPSALPAGNSGETVPLVCDITSFVFSIITDDVFDRVIGIPAQVLYAAFVFFYVAMGLGIVFAVFAAKRLGKDRQSGYSDFSVEYKLDDDYIDSQSRRKHRGKTQSTTTSADSSSTYIHLDYEMAP